MKWYKQLWMWVAILSLVLNTACTTLPSDSQNEPSFAFIAGMKTSSGQLFKAALDDHPGKSGIQLLDSGRDALQMRLALLDMAERAIDLQYYIWNSDTSGRLLAERVLKAADRGVRVRLLLDDFNVGDRDAPLVAMDGHPNVEVRIYNPNASRKGLAKWLALIGEFGRLNQRMHNKSFVVDGTAAIVGGRNIGDEYFDLGENLNFRDRDLIVVGPVVSQISQGFDDYWNSQRSFSARTISSVNAEQVDSQGLRHKLQAMIRHDPEPGYALPADRQASLSKLEHLRSELIWADATAVFDRVREPEDVKGEQPKQVAQTLGEMVQNSRKEILIESAYLILGDEGSHLFKKMTARGVSVRALTNSLASNDLTTNHAGYARRRPQMLASGIELYELRPDAASCQQLTGSSERCGEESIFGLHSKSMVFDRATVFVGSFNLNLRSVYLNSEIGLVVKSRELAERIAADIKENMRKENSWRVMQDENGMLFWTGWKNGKQVRYLSEPETGFWRRLKSGLFSLLPVEKYL